MTTETRIETARRLKAAGRFADAESELERALDRNGTLTAEERSTLLYELADICAKTGAWHRAQSVIDEALEILGPSAEVRHADLWNALTERRSWVYFRQNRLRDARMTALKLLPKLDADSKRDSALLASVYNTLGGIAYQEGRGEEGMRAIERSIDAYQLAGDNAGLATARMNYGVLLLTEGKWPEAAEQFAQSDAVRGGLANQAGRASNLLNLGLLELSLGESDKARRHLDDSLAMSEETGESHIAAHAQLGLAYLSLIESNVDEADRYLDAAMARDDRMCGDDRVQAAWVKALIECERGSTERALKLARDARRIAQESSLVDCEADCCRALGIAHVRSRQYDLAHDLFTESASLAQRASDPYRRALALLEMSTLCQEASCNDAAQAARWTSQGQTAVDDAVKVFAQLGAKRDLARAETLRSAF